MLRTLLPTVNVGSDQFVTPDTETYAFDRYGNDGTFPYTCTTCGVVCETVEDLGDPDHHEEPNQS